MKNILKQFAEWDTPLTHKTITKAKWQLASLYIFAVVFIVSITTFLTYCIYIETLKNNFDYNLIVLLYGAAAGEQFAIASASHLLHILLVIDASLVIGIVSFGYYFASRTLRPVDQVFDKQKKFTEDVAHELRTPLSVIQTAIETLPEETLSASEVATLKKDLLEETRSLIAMTDTLLVLSEYESGNTKASEPMISSVHIDQLCQEELRKINSYAKQKNIHLKYIGDKGVTLQTDANLLKQILKNLLKNAIDYTPEDGSVEISLEKTTSGVQISIKDTGVGIPKEDQKKIFNRFYKSAHSKQMSKGSGLGLALVQSLVHKLSGTITVQSETNKGATFVMKLPSLK